MDFFVIIFFLCLYYVRPHEWIFVFKLVPTFKITIIMALLALFHKHRGLRWKDVVQTPHDWMMFFYFLWIVGTAPDSFGTFKLIYNLFTFYVVVVITLGNVPRMQSFLNWWTIWILVLSLLAVASEYGFDPTNSYDLTHGWMKGRLAFKTSIFANANALGHSIVPVVTMLYFIGIWKRPVFIKIACGAVMALPIYCLWLTVSKGAFLTGFVTLVVAITFRRPLGVQLLIVLLAITVGWVAIQKLPRMEEISYAKTDMAIQGRVAAFRFGLDMLQERPRGVGWANFESELFQHLHFQKAPHSSYVRVGGELGWPGLCLFMGIMYCCARTLLFARVETVEEERVRRILFVMLVSYAASSWMVGWADRATFFLMVATVSAFHRHLQQQNLLSGLEAEPEKARVSFSNPANLQPALLSPRDAGVVTFPTAPLPVATPTTEILVEAQARPAAVALLERIKWNRLGWIDLILVIILTQITIIFWRYIMQKM